MRSGTGFLHLALVDGSRVVGDATLYFCVVHAYAPPREAVTGRHRTLATAAQAAWCSSEPVARTLWKSSASEDVGHRGSGAHGASGTQGSRTWIAENTILSFNNAARNQLPFIEFDVQLTKDRVPVIWHDFYINDEHGLPLQISDLTIKQFRNFRKHERRESERERRGRLRSTSTRPFNGSTTSERTRNHSVSEQSASGEFAGQLPRQVPQSAPRTAANASGSIARPATSALVLEDDGSIPRGGEGVARPRSNASSSSSDDIDVGKHSPPEQSLAADDAAKLKLKKRAQNELVIADKLSSLRDVFEFTPTSLGFDIECKYPMIDDERSGVRFPPRNEFVDAVLNVVFAYSDQPRRIFFSSFDPGKFLK